MGGWANGLEGGGERNAIDGELCLVNMRGVGVFGDDLAGVGDDGGGRSDGRVKEVLSEGEVLADCANRMERRVGTRNALVGLSFVVFL